jgi:hypothetical protein
MKHPALIIIIAASCFSPISEASESEDPVRQHEAHVHGKAVLNLAFDKTSVLAELETPAVNAVGFEHTPATEAQRARVKEALAIFKDYRNIFTLRGGDCRSAETKVEDPFAGSERHGHKHGHGGHDGHTEFHVSYQLQCERPEAIKAIDITVFNHFPGFSEVQAQWVHPSGQGARKADASSARIEFEF